ncbi:MAG TPA: hypothetical protein VFL79_04590 [Terriglobia bacterium]|nr:hypothetical protein [Terriglobia bacterium]
MGLKATDVFVPGAYPQHTYVERTQALEGTLRDALDTPGQVVSLSGPSKSGKTVLVERVVGRDLLIPVSGASIRQPGEVWEHVLDWMDVPSTTSGTRSLGSTISAGVIGKAGIGIPLVAKGEASLSGTGTVAGETTTEVVRGRRGLPQVVNEIGNSEFVVLLDDFHYMERSVQTEVAKALKEAVRLGVKVVTAAVTHRGDDVVRANPELRGRVRAIDLGYWNEGELEQISQVGFRTLNAQIDPGAVEKFTEESAGSPQLMQLLCLQCCFVLNLREEGERVASKGGNIDKETLTTILEQTSASTDFRSLVDILDNGPRTRGTERKTYTFRDGTEGDVYRAVLQALAADPPRLSFPYEELLRRTAEVCTSESPVGSSVTGTCLHMTRLAQEKFPDERAVDWDEQKQVFDIPDPYLLFYLRWSGRLHTQ